MNQTEFSEKWNVETLWNKRKQNIKELNEQRRKDYYKKLATTQCSDDYAPRVKGEEK